jgi:hypothetical protein
LIEGLSFYSVASNIQAHQIKRLRYGIIPKQTPSASVFLYFTRRNRIRRCGICGNGKGRFKPIFIQKLQDAPLPMSEQLSSLLRVLDAAATGTPPARITQVWPIANSLLQRRLGHCEYADIVISGPDRDVVVVQR